MNSDTRKSIASSPSNQDLIIHLEYTLQVSSSRLNTLDVLPSGGGAVGSNGQSIEANAVSNVAGGDGGVLQGSEDLVLGGGSSATGTAGGDSAVGGGAGHEAGGALASVAPVTESGARSVGEGTVRGASGLVGGVGGGEAKSTLGVDVDGLATGDNNILNIRLAIVHISSFCGTYKVVATGDHGLVGLGNALDGGVALGVTTEPEVAASSVEGQQVDGGSRASGDDAEGGIRALGLLGAGDGSHQRGESEKGRELHCERRWIGIENGS